MLAESEWSPVVTGLIGLVAIVFTALSGALVYGIRKLTTWPDRALKAQKLVTKEAIEAFEKDARETRRQHDEHLQRILSQCEKSHIEAMREIRRQGGHLHDLRNSNGAIAHAISRDKAATPEEADAIVRSIIRRVHEIESMDRYRDQRDELNNGDEGSALR